MKELVIGDNEKELTQAERVAIKSLRALQRATRRMMAMTLKIEPRLDPEILRHADQADAARAKREAKLCK